MTKLQPIDPQSLPKTVPPVPRGFTVETDWDGQVFATAPRDRRKGRGRVPAEPKRWSLRTNSDQTEFEWVPLDDFNTRPIREFMLAQGLRMEIDIPGFQMTHKAPKCSTILRQEYGMTGKPAELLEQFVKFRKISLREHK